MVGCSADVAHSMEEDAAPLSPGLGSEVPDVLPLEVDVVLPDQPYAFLEDFHASLLRQ